MTRDGMDSNNDASARRNTLNTNVNRRGDRRANVWRSLVLMLSFSWTEPRAIFRFFED